MNLLVKILVGALIFFLVWFLIGLLFPVISATGVLVCHVILVIIAIVWLVQISGFGFGKEEVK